MNIQHSSRSDAWGTPDWIAKKVHEVIGFPDLDPASEDHFNQSIKARRILTKEDDGLVCTWTDRPITIFLNPPGSKQGNKSTSILFWQRLMHYRTSGLLDEAIFMGFSIEQLQTSQNKDCPSMCEFPVCIPSRRLAFVSKEGVQNSPSHSNVIVYVPSISNNTSVFKAVFGDVGAILHGS